MLRTANLQSSFLYLSSASRMTLWRSHWYGQFCNILVKVLLLKDSPPAVQPGEKKKGYCRNSKHKCYRSHHKVQHFILFSMIYNLTSNFPYTHLNRGYTFMYLLENTFCFVLALLKKFLKVFSAWPMEQSYTALQLQKYERRHGSSTEVKILVGWEERGLSSLCTFIQEPKYKRCLAILWSFLCFVSYLH